MYIIHVQPIVTYYYGSDYGLTVSEPSFLLRTRMGRRMCTYISYLCSVIDVSALRGFMVVHFFMILS